MKKSTLVTVKKKLTAENLVLMLSVTLQFLFHFSFVTLCYVGFFFFFRHLFAKLL